MIKPLFSKKIFTKNNFLLSLLLGLSVSATTTLADKQQIFCPNVENYAEKFTFQDTPFLGLDEEKTLAQLPDSSAKEVLLLKSKLDKLYEGFDEQTFELEDPKKEAEIIDLEMRLEKLFADANVQYVEVNLLDELSDQDREEALNIWCDIAYEIDQHEQRLDTKYSRLDQVLHKF